MSETYEITNLDEDGLIDIQNNEDIEKSADKVIVRYEKSAQIIKVRKRQLFDKLNSEKLTYVKGGICDSFIKYGYPSLEDVIQDVQTMTYHEDLRLKVLIKQLEKRRLKYDGRVSYFRDYVEQGTDLKTTIREGKKEWFLINNTDYLRLLPVLEDEEDAEEEAIQRYIQKKGYNREFIRHIGRMKEFEMKITLY